MQRARAVEVRWHVREAEPARQRRRVNEASAMDGDGSATAQRQSARLHRRHCELARWQRVFGRGAWRSVSCVLLQGAARRGAVAWPCIGQLLPLPQLQQQQP